MVDEGGEQLLHLKNHALQRELLLRTEPSLPAQVECLFRVVRNPLDCLSQGHRIRGRNKQSILFVMDQLGDAAHV